uniref:Uncharacterized protein n=1 Tax=Panagrolaimus sp. PS1159 TaxID=55785 RepID=A0AC35G1Q5_9BILA
MGDCFMFNTLFKTFRPKASTKTDMPLSTSYTSHASTSDSKTSDQNANPTKNYRQPQISREDFNELKSKLSVLKNILEDQKADDKNEHGEGEQSFEKLSHENELLRQELFERDQLIESLRKQLASTSVKN